MVQSTKEKYKREISKEYQNKPLSIMKPVDEV